ncbi:hypothetical protein SAMN05216480_10485 [Pustulibacterium marinum]|uniref:ABM domain-containing protein n=1 Tax=Pustulibacterium marinum TaxID=1224947 RepID=A0A1I7GC52_9FLAO|nr:antibiotic biosynthesis monooxygenase [Pustulibacterium marinum]SFU46005.1 hypothetical protein SAMN05216480_10485 [Pustulibacterium marinum]
MLVRIVKLTFQDDKIADFTAHFEVHKNTIRHFEGCQFLELYQDKNNPAIFFTYSYWENEEALEKYRNSDVFKNIWKTVKVWFGNKPEAWSVNKLVTVE